MTTGNGVESYQTHGPIRPLSEGWPIIQRSDEENRGLTPEHFFQHLSLALLGNLLLSPV